MLGKALLPAMLLGAAMTCGAQTPQISEGVRVMMSIGKHKPAQGRYWMIRQPPLYSHWPPGTARFFNAEAELVGLFNDLPATFKGRGLWVTRTGTQDEETAEDRQHLALLAQEAGRSGLVLYACAPALSGQSQLVAWMCQRESPPRSEEIIACVPRDKPHMGHPWWDCTASDAESRRRSQDSSATVTPGSRAP